VQQASNLKGPLLLHGVRKGQQPNQQQVVHQLAATVPLVEGQKLLLALAMALSTDQAPSAGPARWKELVTLALMPKMMRASS